MGRTAKTSTSDWSSLPEDLIISIAKRLHTRVDILYFRAVCTSFRSSVSLPSKPLSPCVHLNISIPPLSIHHASSGRLELAHFTFYAIQPVKRISHPRQTTETWLVKVQELNSGKVRLEDPLSRLCLGNMSKMLPKLRNLPRFFNLLDYRVKEVARAYRLQLVSQSNDDKPVVFSKAVVSSHEETDDGFAVMAIDAWELLVWRNLDKKWSTIRPNLDFSDIIYHNNKFYASTPMGLTISVTVDCDSLTVSQVARPLERTNYWSNLVKSINDLFLIVKCSEWTHERNDFKVYKLDEQNCQWVQVVDGPEDRVFFVGDDCSFSVSATEFSGCKGNCVYFRDGPFRIDGCHPGTDGGIFYLKDGTVRRLFPEHYKIFWPPPIWVRK